MDHREREVLLKEVEKTLDQHRENAGSGLAIVIHL